MSITSEGLKDGGDPGTYLQEIRCNSCRRTLGVAPADVRIYCDYLCAKDYAASASEARDCFIFVAWTESSLLGSPVSKADIGKVYGLSRQRVDQIIRKRKSLQG